MTPLEVALRRAVADLDAIGLDWALVGGLAVSARSEPRTTRDIDLAVAVTDDSEAESAIFQLQQRGYSLRTLLEHSRVHRLATARLRMPDDGGPRVLVDLLFASSGIEPEVVAGASILEILPGFQIAVASVGHLIALKVLSRDDRNRPQDYDDLMALLDCASDDDLDQARRALDDMQARNFHRRQSLFEGLERAVSESRALRNTH